MKRPRSRHMDLEILASAALGRMLDPGVLVPGCGCPICTDIPEDSPARKPFRVVKEGNPLPVEVAGAVPCIEVAERIGLDLRRVGRSWRGPCPIHDGDAGPCLHPLIHMRRSAASNLISPSGRTICGMQFVRASLTVRRLPIRSRWAADSGERR